MPILIYVMELNI